MTQRLITVGGVGGSGTRSVIRLLRMVGVYIGANVNRALDSLDFQDRFMVEWLKPTLEAWLQGDPNIPIEGAHRSFEGFLARHLEPARAVPEVVAWKHPRTQYCLPTLRRIRPDLRFIHLVRDGRDMVLSANQHQRDHLGPIVLTGEEQTRSLQVQSQLVWARSNDMVADFGEGEMGGDYLRVRFEDLCFEPERVIGEILEFAGIGEVTPELVSEIQPPESIGRWRTGALDPFDGEFAAALERFGYTGDLAAPDSGAAEAAIAEPIGLAALQTSGLSGDVVVVGGYHKYAPGVVARILRLGDRFMGARRVDRDLFATDFAELARDWRQRVLRAWFAGAPVPRGDGIEDRTAQAIARHFEGIELSGRPWGFADQHAIEMLPVLDALIPGMKFIHVVADPRSRPDLRALLPGWARQAAFRAGWDGFRTGEWSELWAEMNRRAAEYGERVMGERYLRVRVEDLIAEPEGWVDRISRFAGHGPATAQMISEMWLTPPERETDRSVVPGSLYAAGLAEFGYADESTAEETPPVSTLEPETGSGTAGLFAAGLSEDVLVVGGYHVYGLAVLMRALRMSGRFMGGRRLAPDLSPRGFPKAIAAVRHAVVRAWLEGTEMPVAETDQRFAEFVLDHIAGTDPTEPWGWVDRRALDVLPLLDALVPSLRFVHVLSDPRTRPDAAAPLPEWALTAALRAGYGGFEAGKWIELWAKLNTMAADHGERVMGKRYVRVRVEDLVTDPQRWMGEIAAFSGTEATPAMAAEASLLTLREEEAWTGEPPRLVAEAMERFGY